MIFLNLLRFFGALSLSVVFGFFSFFIVQVVWSLGGGSMGWWPKLLVDIAWFYTPAFLGSLAIVFITWFYSDIKGKKLVLAILFVYLCSYQAIKLIVYVHLQAQFHNLIKKEKLKY